MMSIHQDVNAFRVSLPTPRVCDLMELALRRGYAAEHILANTDLTADMLRQPDARITTWQYTSIILNVLTLTKDPSIALQLGLQRSQSKASFLRIGLKSCNNLLDAIELSKRLLPIQNPFLKLELRLDGDMAVISVEEAFPLLRCRTYLIENFMVGNTQIFRELLRAGDLSDSVKPAFDFDQIHLCFDFAEPEYFAMYKHRLPKILFNQVANQICFPAKLLQFPIRTANPVTRNAIMHRGESVLSKLGLGENWLERVRSRLVCRDGTYPDLPSMAQDLYVSERTLKRKLADFDVSYSDLLDTVRLRDAQALLGQFDLNIGEIARRLGYQDRSNFTRAFRRWSGMAPSEYRKELYIEQSYTMSYPMKYSA